MLSDDKPNDRRTFIKNTILVVVSASIPSLVSCKDNQKDPVPSNGECITTDDILGPFYKAGAPFQENIIPSGNITAPLIIHGKVFSNCDTLLKNAIVEIWNADDKGEYDSSSEFRFRGQYKTLVDGVYSFRTIVPGRYLNGETFRPSHIHFRVTAPGHEELVSQIYFKDDPFIDDDPWAGSPKATERILILDKDANETDTVTFDIHLLPA
jgi:protocatechuate 3,4-dioxygenase beta subunit